MALTREGLIFRHILVPTDFTPKSRAALEAALRVASPPEARITLLHVIETVADGDQEEFRAFYDKLVVRAEGELGQLAAEAGRMGVELNCEVVLGRRALEILRYAGNHGVDLIVLGSHPIRPETPMQGWGTISYKVAVLASCPVLMVK